MKKIMSVAEVKKHFSEILEKIVYQGDIFIIQKRGKPTAAIISMNELNGLEKYKADVQCGLISAAGAWSDYEDIDSMIKDIYQSRNNAKDREVKIE